MPNENQQQVGPNRQRKPAAFQLLLAVAHVRFVACELLLKAGLADVVIIVERCPLLSSSGNLSKC
jgi:hypothetical protein